MPGSGHSRGQLDPGRDDGLEGGVEASGWQAELAGHESCYQASGWRWS